MKKIAFKVIGVLLVASCLFGVISAGGNLSDILRCKSSWEKIGEESEENLNMLGDGIDRLGANSETYRNGAETYETSLKQYEEGVAAIAEAKEKLAAGKSTYAAGQATYSSSKAAYDQKVEAVNEAKEAVAEGESTLEANREAYEAGKQQLEENKQAYEEGKEKLEKAQIIYDIVKPIDEAASSNSVTDAITDVEIGGYSIGGIVDEYEAGKAQIDQYEAGMESIAQYEAGVQKIAESKATIAEYDKKLAEAAQQLEAGAAKLGSAAAQIKSGELQIADGEAQLADGKTQLDAGKAQLSQYEAGEAQLADGLDTALNQDTYYDDNGHGAIPSIKSRLGSGFTFYETDAVGNVVAVNGVDFVSIDKANTVLDTAWDFYNDTVAHVSEELTGRIICLALACAACLIGIFAGVGAFTNHRILTAITSAITAVAAIAAYLYISAAAAGGYVFSKHVGSSGHGYLALAVGIVAVISILTCAVGFLASDKKPAPAAVAE